MTLNTTYKPAVAQGNGIIKEFSYSFNPLSLSYIKVYFEIDGKWVEQKTGWSATVSDSGGIVTFLEAPKTRVSIERDMPESQPTSYTTSSGFQASVIEHSFDLLTGMVQELKDASDRSVKVEVGDNQTPEELLQTVYDKLDSATEIAGDAISAANQAQTAADNATESVKQAKQTLVNVTAYVDSAKVDIDNTKNTVIETIDSTVAQAKADVNSAIDEAAMDISNIVSDAEGSITNIAVTEANKAIANATQEATDTATANVNNYVNETILPPLQTYVDQAQEDANSAATSMEQAALSATAASNYASNARADADNAANSAATASASEANAKTSETNAKTSETNALIWAEGTDAEVQALGGTKSAKGWAEASENLNYTNITNCITEIPQDIKLELNNGTLTLKAGSKVYVPNGFETTTKIEYYAWTGSTGTVYTESRTPVVGSYTIEEDFMVGVPIEEYNPTEDYIVTIPITYYRDSSKDKIVTVPDTTKPKFDEVIINSDKTYSWSGGTVTGLLWVNSSNNIDMTASDYCYSGTTQPTASGLWYDTSSNIMKFSNDNGSSWTIQKSLPVAIITVTSGTGVTSINQVFNGFGYIGSTVYALPGVKGLIPNGRNADGSLRNIEFTTSSVLTRTDPTYTGNYIFTINSNRMDNYETANYDYAENINKNSSGNDIPMCFCGTFSRTSGVISNFSTKTAFHAVDYNDFSDLDSNVVHKTGDETINGTKTFTNNMTTNNIYAKGNITLGTSTNTWGKMVQFEDTTGKRIARIQPMAIDTTNNRVGMWVNNVNNSVEKGIFIDSDGTTSAPASDASNSIVTTEGINKSPNGYVKLGNGMIIQWGNATMNNNTTTTFSFARAFSSASSYAVTQGYWAPDSNRQDPLTMTAKTNTGFTIRNTAGSGTNKCFWIAVGY